MKTIAVFSHVKSDKEIDLPVSNLRHGGIQCVWTLKGNVKGRVTIQCDVDRDGVWQELISSALSGNNSLNFRFPVSLPEKSRVKLDLREGELERFNVFLTGKEKKNESKND